jgi:hypothetical protein
MNIIRMVSPVEVPIIWLREKNKSIRIARLITRRIVRGKALKKWLKTNLTDLKMYLKTFFESSDTILIFV